MDVKSFSLKGKVALVLGGAGDLGHAIAETFSLAGADVIISSRKQENLDKVAEEIKAKSKGKVVGIAGHLGKLETIKALVDTVMKDFGSIDVVVNSSGSSFMVPLTDIEEWQWDNVMNVNVKGPFFLLKQIAPIMKAQGGGSIINISSYMGIRTEETLGVYCISKAAVLHMTRAMAKELGPRGITVNTIAPGVIETEMTTTILKERGANILAMTPLPRVVWMQLGIHHGPSAQRLRDAGIEVVQDRCIMVDHRRLIGARES